MKRSSRLILGTAIFCLFISGAAGLVYQVVWMRYLSLFLGNTGYAVVAVLVAFMGGLALGNVWLGAKADRVRRPLAFYAWLEIGIALYALIFPFYYDFCHQAYLDLARHFSPGSASLLALKFAFSLLTILVPTVLMGGTLPVMTKLVTRSLGELRERVATLYFINSLGAVFGCFLSDFWWIPAMGLHYTVLAGAAMNLAVGAAALFVSGWTKEEENRVDGADAGSMASDGESFSPGELKLAVVGIGVSGFVAMLYEVVWTRMLALALGSSTHAFSLMLITFITGIAAGAWIVGRWKKLRRTMDAFGWAELVLATTLLVSMFFYDLIPFWFIRIADLLARRPEAYPVYEFVQATICFGVMFVPTVCLGTTLPLVSRIATAELARTGRSVGAVFSVNTLGTVLGAGVTGLWLMPWLGLARTLALGIALNAGVGLITLGRNKRGLRPVFAVGMPAGAVVLVLVAGELFDHSWRQVFTMGLWRVSAPPSLAAYRKYADRIKLKYYRDGAGSTVSVNTDFQGQREDLVLSVNGKADAGTTTDVPTQLLLGHIPVLLHPSPQRILVVGLGSGMTCGAVMRHPGVAQLDVVEISPEVARAARLFEAYNDKVLDNPRVRLVIDDAKTLLQTTGPQYDVIISEPSNPWMAGVAGVFSREYYESCRKRLQPDGVMAQWVQSYETDDRVLEIVLRSFASVFPFFSIWQPGYADLVLVGSTRPFVVDLAALQRRFDEPGVKASFERMDLFRLPVFLAREIVSPQNAPFIPRPDAPIHSDFYPTLEFAAQRAFFVRGDASLHRKFDENLSTRPTTLLGRYLRANTLSEDDYKAFALFQNSNHLPGNPLFRSLLKRWRGEFPEATLPCELLAKSVDAASADELEAGRLGQVRDQLMRKGQQEPEPLRLYADVLLRAYRSGRSVFLRPPTTELKAVLERLVEADSTYQRVHKLRLAELAWDEGDDTACFKLAQNALDPDPKVAGPIRFDIDPGAPARVLARMIESLWRAGKMDGVVDLSRQARAQGYAGRSDGGGDPLLEMTVRKAEMTSSLSAPAQKN